MMLFAEICSGGFLYYAETRAHSTSAEIHLHACILRHISIITNHFSIQSQMQKLARNVHILLIQ